MRVDFRSLKERVSLEQVLMHYEQETPFLHTFTRKDSTLRGPCPFCQSGHPRSLSISLDRNCFRCFARDCTAQGNILDFVALWENVTVREAAEKIAGWFPGAERSAGRGRRPAVRPTATAGRVAEPGAAAERATAPTGLSTPAGNAIASPPASKGQGSAGQGTALPVLANPPLTFALQHIDSDHPHTRTLGLHPQTLHRFGIGFYAGRGLFKDHLVLPIRNGYGDLVAYAGRRPDSTDPDWQYPPTFRRDLELYNLDRAVRSEGLARDELIVVQEPLAVAALEELGYAHAVALLNRAASPAQAAAIAELVGGQGRVLLIAVGDPETATALLPWGALARAVACRLLVVPQPLTQLERADAQARLAAVLG